MVASARLQCRSRWSHYSSHGSCARCKHRADRTTSDEHTIWSDVFRKSLSIRNASIESLNARIVFQPQNESIKPMHGQCAILIPAFACLLGLHPTPCQNSLQASAPTIVDVRKIWSQPTRQSSFTDLIRYKNAWICCFREGTAHSSDDGRIQIIRSSDGISWTGLAKIECPPPNKDLRDPKLSITPDKQLLLTSTAYLPRTECRSYTWLSQDGKNWGEPHAIGPPGGMVVAHCLAQKNRVQLRTKRKTA